MLELTPMLELRGIEAGYGDIAVLHGIDLEVRAGEIVALIGANGAGKTTLAKVISGLLPARRGRILLDGEAIERLSPPARIARGIAQVPEGRQIIAGLTVRENLRLGGYTRRRALGAVGMAALVSEAGRQFPVLAERLDGLAGNLSGGQQQMLAIARALMIEPKLLILDEPSIGLSPLLVAEIFRHIASLRSQGLAILLSEQNARMSLAIADRAYVMEKGRIVLAGRGAALLDNPEVAARYLGMGKAAQPSGDATDASRHATLVRGLARILGTDAET
jgi:branched-chain amino acid transport system ATP-binding protein